MQNIILNKIIDSRNGHYCHVIEVSNIYDIENCIEAIYLDFKEYGIDALKEFFNTIETCYLYDDELTEDENTVNENDVYDFCTDLFIDETLF